MAVGQKKNNALWPEGHNGTHVAGELVTARTRKHWNTDCHLLPSSPFWLLETELGRGTDLSMSFILASLGTLKKLTFVLLNLLEVYLWKVSSKCCGFSQLFLSLPIRLHKPSFQKHRTSLATPPCIFCLVPNAQKSTLPKGSARKGDGSAAEIHSMWMHIEPPLPPAREVSGRFRDRSLLFIPTWQPSALLLPA